MHLVEALFFISVNPYYELVMYFVFQIVYEDVTNMLICMSIILLGF